MCKALIVLALILNPVSPVYPGVLGSYLNIEKPCFFSFMEQMEGKGVVFMFSYFLNITVP